jgi:RND family efflux transporter MFP subunit
VNRWIAGLVVLVVLGIIGGAGYWGFQRARPAATTTVVAPPTVPVGRGDVQLMITAPGQLVSTHEMTVSATVAASILKLMVHPGQRVRSGDLLAQLDDTNLQSAVRTAQAGLTSAQSAYDAAVNKSSHGKDQLTVAKAALDKATVALQSAQSAYDKVAWRSDIGMLSQSADLQKATIDYQSALANYNLTVTDINDSSVKSAAQALVQAQEALAQARDNLNQAKLAAPFDGIVLEVLAKAGDKVQAGAGLVCLFDPQAIEARTTVTEEDYPLARVGEKAQVYFDALPELVITGTVSYIVPLRDASSTSPVYPVYISLENVPDTLAPGMTVDGSVLISKQSNVLRLPRALVHARSDGTAQIQVWNGRETETRTIKAGLRGDQYVEIVTGLNEGEQVVSR